MLHGQVKILDPLTIERNEFINKIPYGKHKGHSCELEVKLPADAKLSDIETEILNYDVDWISPDPKKIGQFTIFNQGEETYRYHQNVVFEESSFTFDITFIDPSSVPKFLDYDGRENPYYATND